MMKSIIVLLLLLSPVILPAQQHCKTLKATPECDNGWMSVSFGVDNDPNFDFNTSISANIGRELFWRVSATSRGNIFGDTQIGSIDIMRGISKVDRIGRVSISAGMSLLSFQNYDYMDQSVFKPGLSVVAEALFTPVKEIGMGADLICTVAENYQSIGVRFVFAIEGHK